MKQYKISVNAIYISIIAYLYIPLLIFLLGWVKLIVALPVIAVTAVGIFFSMRNIYRSNTGNKYGTLLGILIAFLGFFLFFVVAGHSDLFAQDYDWHKHHAVFNDLMNFEWPVVYENNSMLTYYLGSYIVPSFFGKIFHSALVMRWAIPVWNAIGLTIVYSTVCYLLKLQTIPKKVITFFIILLWGGATVLGNLIYHGVHSDVLAIIPFNYKWIDIETIRVHFASNYDALHDAFQHVITPWLSVCFFMCNKKNYESYIMIALPLLFSATFGFVYFVPILLIYALWNLRRSKFAEWIKSVFGWGNCLMLPLTAILIMYFYDYLLSEKPSSMGFKINTFKGIFDFYLIFVLVEFFAYSLLLFKTNKRNPIFYIINVELLIIPFISLGLYNDLLSRGSIPARFILMILCLELFYNTSMKNWRMWGVSILLSISILTTCVQIRSHMVRTYEGRENKSYIADNFKTLEYMSGNPSIREDEAYNYYTFDYTESLFYKIAKK